MTNKYLEKVALTISKARSMAKEVGVIPDHTSAWKYALRILRNSRGQALTGEDLKAKRISLGDLSSEGYATAKTKSLQAGINTEIAGVVNNKTGNISNISTGEKGALSAPNVRLGNFHSHPMMPGYSDKSADGIYRLGYPHRESSPSGYYTAHTGYLNRKYTTEGMVEGSSDYNSWNNTANKDFKRVYRHQHLLERILHPHSDTVSVTSMRRIPGQVQHPDKPKMTTMYNPRVIYFKHDT